MTDWANVPVFGTLPEQAAAIVRPSAYGIVTDGLGHLAVVQTPTGLSLPGGGSDAAETPEATVVRETHEECGLELHIGPWCRIAIEFVFSRAEQTQFEKRNTFCDATVLRITGEPTEPDHRLEWLPVGEAAARLVPPSHRWAVVEWQSSSTSPQPH